MPSTQANIEYFFRLFYDLFYGPHASLDFSAFGAFVAHLWLWVIIVGYALAVIGLFIIVYCTVRIFELRKREEEFYSTIIPSSETKGAMHPRWEHIQTLLEGAGMSEWREAIVEADIMLDNLLTKEGYTGAGVGEKLKSVDETEFKTLQDAWEAHKVRNQIAHQGSTFDLSQVVAQRTIARYENVFREFGVI
ncbi:MAG: hypothetical protein PHV99_02085 [Candidatus Pacebacteria bacterium]|nr:hypothetical protein [Candidatus Paceibacterota bacterium]